MKKIVLSTLAFTALFGAGELDTQIASTKAQMKVLEDKLKSLESKRPQNQSIMSHTALGYMQTKGNTDTKTLTLDASLKKEFGKNALSFNLDGQYADDNGIESKNKYFLELNYDYNFTDRFAFNYLVGFKDDKFSAYTYQAYTGPGAKYKLVKNDKHDLSLDGNILYSVDEYSQTSTRDKYSSYQAKGVYAWQMMENLKFAQELSYRSAFEDANNYFVYSSSALSSKISDVFSAGMSYKVDYVNLSGTKDNTDTTLSFNLIIDY